MTVVYLFALLVGLGGWLPTPTSHRRSWDGFIFLQSWLLLIVLLYMGDVVFGIALSHLVIILGMLAGGGAAFRLYRSRRTSADVIAQLGHPIWVLMALVCAVVAAKGGIAYLPFPGDETASWLRLARQIFLVDAYWSDAVNYHLGAYTNGWPLLIAFTNSFYGVYDDSHGVAVAFVMQLGLIGATFDVARHIFDQEDLKIDGAASHAAAWLFVLALLSVEASWILLPTFQLIDEPLIFAFLGCFLTALLGLYEACNRRLLAIYLGLAIAATYLLKITAVAFLPGAVLFLVAVVAKESGRSVRETLTRWDAAALRRWMWLGLAIFLPVLVTNISWQYFKIGTTCNASPLLLLTGGSGPAIQQPIAVALGFMKDSFDFVASYKFPLTALATLSLFAGLFYGRSRWIVLAFICFVAVYVAAMYFAYLTCFDVIELGKFEALPRYMRTPVRLSHYLGLVVGVIVILHDTAWRERIRRALSAKSVRGAMGIVIILLLGWQVHSAGRSIDDMRTRDYQDPVLRTMIHTIKDQSSVLITEIERRHLRDPGVNLIAQGGYGAEYDLAMYFGIKSRADGGSNFIYIPRPPFFWATNRSNIFTDVTEPEKLEQFWRGFDIIWPYRTDEWTRNVLARLIDDPTCRADPEGYFLFRTPAGSFECVPK